MPERVEADRPRSRYLAHVRVRFHELDPLGHVNNAAYLTYLEQAAIDHAAVAGFDIVRLRELGGLFIARRHEIDFLRPAFEGDLLRIETWIDDLRGARAIRRYDVRRLERGSGIGRLPPDRLLGPAEAHSDDGETIVRAQTEWAFVDFAEGKPRRIPPALQAWFADGRDAPSPAPDVAAASVSPNS